MTAVAEAPAGPWGHLTRMPVYFDDLDAQGVLHNARYAVLVERAITVWWASRGVSFAGGRPTTPDAFNVVRDYGVTFHAPVRGTGEIGLHFWIERLGRTSADYRFRVLSADGATVHAEGRRVNVRVDPATGRPAPWTDDGRALAALLLRGSDD
jgi:acyl-CoA thioester hydrolase